MAGGRPTKYGPDMLLAAKDYLENWESTGDMIPNVAGLACELGVCIRTIHNWSAEHDEFMHITRGMMSAQERKLLSGGLSGDFNPNITKLILGKHGYSDKQDNTLSGPDGGPIQTDNTWTVEVIEPE